MIVIFKVIFNHNVIHNQCAKRMNRGQSFHRLDFFSESPGSSNSFRKYFSVSSRSLDTLEETSFMSLFEIYSLKTNHTHEHNVVYIISSYSPLMATKKPGARVADGSLSPAGSSGPSEILTVLISPSIA